ncbi:MAG: hypothetical protein E1N59_1133 [Puniceicoccaceae bacterium 5H]|nr:MAG: hypothetical protein E1N59_1133 [Puniceicoccaceae bacterium 5H]
MAVFLQLRYLVRQMRFDAFLEIQEATRELIQLGFDHPDLLAVLEQSKTRRKARERKYAQLWLNQLNLAFAAYRQKHVPRDLWRSFETNIRAFVQADLLRSHWPSLKPFYPSAFQAFLDKAVAEGATNSSGTAPSTAGRCGKTKPS